MKISHHQLLFIGLFMIAPIFAIGKREQVVIPDKPVAIIGRIDNETNKTLVLEIIGTDDWLDTINIVPGDQLVNRTIPLSANASVEYDLVRFDTESGEGDPAEQLYLRINREIIRVGHYIEVRVLFTLGIVDWSTEPETDSRILETRALHYLMHEHTLDNYLINITLRGQGLSDSHFEINSRSVPE